MLLRVLFIPIPTPNVPPYSGALGSTRKPPGVSLKFGVNSIASASLLAYAFHFSQNSTVTWLVPERFMLGMAPLSLVPLKASAVLASPSTAPSSPNVPPAIVPLALPLLSLTVGPAVSPSG